MRWSNFLKLPCLKTRTLVILNSRYASCGEFCTNSKRENKNKRKLPLGVGSAVGVAFGIGIMYYNFCDKKKNPLKEISRQLIDLQSIFSAECSALNSSQNENKVSARARYNFLADVAEKTAPSVVYIEIDAMHPVTRKRFPISNGSGFIVKSDGLILTNAHVVSGYGHVIVKLYDGREFEGSIESLDTKTDLATVRIKANGLPALPLGQSTTLRPGEFVIAMGNPLSLSHTITAGVISSANRQGKELGLHKTADYIQTDAAINVGNSGGPLVNLDGEVVGINTMKVTEGISFAIPSDRAVEFLNRIEEVKLSSWNPFSKSPRKKKQKYLGITMLTLTSTIIREIKEYNPHFPDVNSGVMVYRVTLGSPSHECGIKPGDVITRINGKNINSASDIYELLTSEDVLNIHIIREKKEFDVIVKLFDPIV